MSPTLNKENSMNRSSIRTRPFWVWIISIPSILANVWGLISIFLLLSGIVQAPPELTASINERLAGNAPFFLIAYGCLSLVAAITLFRLRKVAFYLFAILLGVSLFNIEIDELNTSFDWSILIADWSILIAICIYTWRLKQNGVLR